MIKRTLQEIANFFGMAVAIDEDGRTYMHKAVPYIQGGRGWLNNGMLLFELPHYLVEEYSGDWRESLTLPDSWPKEEAPFNVGELVISMYRDWETDRKSTRLNSSHSGESRMPSSA